MAQKVCPSVRQSSPGIGLSDRLAHESGADRLVAWCNVTHEHQPLVVFGRSNLR
jgi:hypothetical protein